MPRPANPLLSFAFLAALLVPAAAPAGPFEYPLPDGQSLVRDERDIAPFEAGVRTEVEIVRRR